MYHCTSDYSVPDEASSIEQRRPRPHLRRRASNNPRPIYCPRAPCCPFIALALALALATRFSDRGPPAEDHQLTLGLNHQSRPQWPRIVSQTSFGSSACTLHVLAVAAAASDTLPHPGLTLSLLPPLSPQPLARPRPAPVSGSCPSFLPPLLVGLAIVQPVQLIPSVRLGWQAQTLNIYNLI